MAVNQGVQSDVFIKGYLDPNYTAPASAFSESTSEHRETVPAGKRWFLVGAMVVRDANETLAVNIYDGTNLVLPLFSGAAATGTVTIPNTSSGTLNLDTTCPIMLDAGWYIRYVFGGAQGAGAVVSTVVIQIDV